MADLQPVRGTRDLLGDDMRSFRHVVDNATDVAANYGYDEAATPIFEFTSVFQRPLGETSDIVTKEMYSFTDKGGENITLRPENTAGIARAFMSGGLAQHTPCKFFYAGPMFRYERPQKGRLRQFHQIGIEVIGAAQASADIEVIACGHAILERLGFADKITLELNTLGDTESRNAYRDALVDYFQAFKDQLSEDSLNRLDKNPLRILDSKDEGDKKLVADAPLFAEYLNTESLDFYATVKEGLTALSIPFSENPRLVRGMDYYCHTAFEFTTTELGAQGTVMAGGRYDGLISMLGGAATPGIGWAAGVERLSMMVADQVPPKQRPITIIPMGGAAENKANQLVDAWRRCGIRIEVAYGGNFKKRMKYANKVSATHCFILGDDDLARNVIQFKDLDTGHQTEISLDGLDTAKLSDMLG